MSATERSISGGGKSVSATELLELHGDLNCAVESIPTGDYLRNPEEFWNALIRAREIASNLVTAFGMTLTSAIH